MTTNDERPRDGRTRLTGQQVAEEGLEGWVHLVGGLQTRITTSDFRTGLRLVDAIGEVADELDHHPEVDLRYAHVDLRLTSHDAGGVTERDIRLARRVSRLAADAGLRVDVAGVSRLELALDTPDRSRVMPFWGAVLAMRAQGQTGYDDDLGDPYGALPLVWFQQSGAEEPRQRWHPDIWVDPAQVRPRIDAALAAGGTLVSDVEAPSYWVLADPDGNRVCLCTWQDRG